MEVEKLMFDRKVKAILAEIEKSCAFISGKKSIIRLIKISLIEAYGAGILAAQRRPPERASTKL